MQFKGINYDTGTQTITGGITRTEFARDTVVKEIEIIRKDLHCNAIRITGFQIDRVVMASEIALPAGLTVWFSASLIYDDRAHVLAHMIESAKAAERLRQKYNAVIFVTGFELTAFTSGFVDGETGGERMKKLFSPLSLIKNKLGISRTYNRRLHKFLFEAVRKVREHFQGQITYASGTWEKVDWTMFDIFGVDHYRSVFNKATYVEELQAFKKNGRPVAIMEFGCCCYQGADLKGATGWAIVDWKQQPPVLKGSFVRDESVQAKYLTELLKIFNGEQVFAAFVFTFVNYSYIYSEDPYHDLDMASYGIVKTLPPHRIGYKGLRWMPKVAFEEVGKIFKI
jgi:hypothetical protein